MLLCSLALLPYFLFPAYAEEGQRQKLVVTNSASWLPFSFLDDAGEPKGLLIDLWRLFGERNNVDVTFELVDLSDSLDLARTGEADVQGGLVENENDDGSLQFSDEIMRVKTMLYVPVSWDVSHLSDIGATPVGVVESSVVERFLGDYFPETVLERYPNSEVMVRAALHGDIQAFVTDYPTGYYQLISMDSLDRFKADHVLFTGSIYAAVAKGSDELLTFVDEGFSKISADDVQALRKRWFVPGEPVRPWILPAVFIFLGLMVLIACVAHYLSLRRTVKKKTEALNASIQELKRANAELDRIARVDPLTGVANRHHLYQSAAIEMERAKRYRRPLSLTVFDLDHLKSTNDEYGHLAGDAMLKKVAGLVRESLRENDVFARIGGDEFIALLLETSLADAVHLTNRILANVRGTPMRFRDGEIDLSFSAGIAEYKTTDTIEEWFNRADNELYRSKTGGRSQVSGAA